MREEKRSNFDVVEIIIIARSTPSEFTINFAKFQYIIQDFTRILDENTEKPLDVF